jgi:hypothetical protein
MSSIYINILLEEQGRNGQQVSLLGVGCGCVTLLTFALPIMSLVEYAQTQHHPYYMH